MLKFGRSVGNTNEPRAGSNLRRPKGKGSARGVLIFTPEHVKYIRHHLARLLRVICIRMQITTEEYDRRQSWYYTTSGDTTNGRSSSKGNLSKSIEPDTITWRAFTKFVEMILRLDIVEIKLVGRDEHGNIREFSSTDDLSDINTPAGDDGTDD